MKVTGPTQILLNNRAMLLNPLPKSGAYSPIFIFIETQKANIKVKGPSYILLNDRTMLLKALSVETRSPSFLGNIYIYSRTRPICQQAKHEK